jgi:hypothetical protein
VIDILDADRSDGRSPQGGKQDPSQGIPDGGAEPAFQGLARKLAVKTVVGLTINFQPFGLNNIGPIFVDHGSSENY